MPQPRLADEADDLAALDREARAGDRPHALAAAPLVHDLDVTQFQRGARHRKRVDVAGEPAAVHRLQRRIVRRADVDGVRRSAGGYGQPGGIRCGVGGVP